jgi:hypothetical protein
MSRSDVLLAVVGVAVVVAALAFVLWAANTTFFYGAPGLEASYRPA